MNEARAIRPGFTECTFRHMAQRQARSATGPAHVFTPLCLFLAAVVLKTLMSGPRHQGVKCFRARSQSAMVLFPCSKTRIAVFGTLIAPAVKDAFQKQRSLAVTTQEFR